MTVHANSIIAWHRLDKESRLARILAVYRTSSCPLTDREVAERLGFTDMNAVRPRITEAIGDDLNPGPLRECPSIICPRTKHRVRTVSLRLPVQMTLADAL